MAAISHMLATQRHPSPFYPSERPSPPASDRAGATRSSAPRGCRFRTWR